MQTQVGGVDHAEHDLLRAFIRVHAATHIAGNDFFQADRIQAIGAWQIEHPIVPAGSGLKMAFLALDGDARIVGDLLPATGEPIEQRGFPAIGIADQRDVQGGGAHGAVAGTATRIRLASTMRSAKRVNPICIASGSPPSGPRAITRTGSPSTKPRSSRRRTMASLSPTPSTPVITAFTPCASCESSIVLACECELIVFLHELKADRKSTRLNYSH